MVLHVIIVCHGFKRFVCFESNAFLGRNVHRSSRGRVAAVASLALDTFEGSKLSKPYRFSFSNIFDNGVQNCVQNTSRLGDADIVGLGNSINDFLLGDGVIQRT